MTNRNSEQSADSFESRSVSPSPPSKRTIDDMLDKSVLIEEVTLEHRYLEPVESNYDILWEEWYTDVSDTEDADEDWLESFLLGPRITEIDVFDDACNQIEEVTNAIIEEHEEFETLYCRPSKRRYVTFREHFSFED